MVTCKYTALRPYAKTDRQRQLLEIVIKTPATRSKGYGDGRLAAAARAAGVSRHSLSDVLRVIQKNAARAGYAPENSPPWVQELPEGHRIKGMSTRVDGAGNVDQQWAKTEREPDAAAMPPVPADHHVVKTATMLDRQGEPLIRWVSTDVAKAAREDAFWKSARAAADSFVAVPEIRLTRSNFRDALCVYPVGDPHIGLLSWYKETGVNFDTRIAEAELAAGVDDLVHQAPRTVEGRLVLLGDNWHAQGDDQLTPASKHKLDFDSRFGKVTEIGLFLFLRLATRLLEKHERVTVDVRCGNHDPSASFWTRLWLAGMLRNNPRISVPENYNPYSYYRFGKVLIGTAHGHLAKDAELMGLMAHDCGPGGTPGCETFWGETHYRHWFLGHIHKDTLDEYPGGKVEHVRTFAGKDAWTHGRYRSGRSLQCVVFDPEFGERSRTVTDIRRVKNLLETSK